MRAWTLLLLGCGQPATDTDTDTPGNYPQTPSEAAISAFIADGAHRGDGWSADTEAPRERNSDVSPHGRVQVWLNDELVASAAAGNGAYGGTAHDAGSMAVKELYDEADVLLGAAVMLKLEGDAYEWAYWCDGPEDRCGVTTAPTDPYYGVARDAECSFCHGGLIFNLL